MATKTKSDAKVLQNMDTLAKRVINEVKKVNNPEIEIPLRTLSNVYFDEKDRMIKLKEGKQKRSYLNVNQAKKFMQTFFTASKCKEVIESGKTTSIRDLFYMTKVPVGSGQENIYEEQEESDPIIEDLEVTIDALREELHLFAASKGSIAGPLTMIDAGDEIDLRKVGSGGHSVPSICEPDTVQFKSCDAKYVLLIEKEAVWRRFNEDKFWKKNNCIIIHGGGVPPRGVRRLMRRMHDELKLPVYVLVDADPWGFYIYSVVKQGSINLAFESMRMAIPDAKFIGLSTFDIEEYKLPKEVTLRLNEEDKKRIQEILNYPWFQNPKWQKQLKHMIQTNSKLELEALSRKNISFITETYVPDKIKNKDWLE